jgi:uncharacterized membrane protein YraQ (UPF0718 family)
MLWGSGAIVAVGYLAHLAFGEGLMKTPVGHFAHGTFELMNAMWWGIALGILFVGLLDRVPRDVVIAALAGDRRTTGVLRATAAGVLFDLCSHGILMVGMKLYERGATIGQTVAFLLASPWNSLSLTVVLIALIGWQYTLAFIVLSAVIAVITGVIFDTLVANGNLPDNPNRPKEGEANGRKLTAAVREWLSGVTPSWPGFVSMLWDGLRLLLQSGPWGMATVPSADFAEGRRAAGFLGPRARGAPGFLGRRALLRYVESPDTATWVLDLLL